MMNIFGGLVRLVFLGAFLFLCGMHHLYAQPLRNDFKPGEELKPVKDFWAEFNHRKEDRTKRDAFSRHYKNEDGSYTAVISAGPIHYMKDGIYEEIKDGIKPNVGSNQQHYPYANTTNIMESYFGAVASKGIISHTAEGDIKEFLNTRMYWSVGELETTPINGSNVPLHVAENKAVYADLYPGIDAEYQIHSGKRKLNYVIHAPLTSIPSGADYLVFSEEVAMNPSWSYEVSEKYGVLIKDGQGKMIYNYEKPTSSDGTNGIFENNTEMGVTSLGNVLTILTKVKTSWLLSTERVYPILVDPTATAYPNNTAYWTGQANSAGGGSSGSPAAGRASSGTWYRGYAKFNTTSLPACTISDAILTIKPTNIQGTVSTATGLGICQSKYDLSSEEFFPAYADVYNAVAAAANMSGDYAAITTNGTLNAYRNFDLGNQGRLDVAAKAGGAGSFFVVGFRQGWTGGTAVNRYMVLGDHASTTNRPYLTITYTQTEPYCHPTHLFSNCAGFGDCQYVGISKVEMGTINNTTAYNNIPIGYTSYASQSTDVLPGSSHSLTITYRDAGGNNGKVAAWIDWDKDGIFQTGEFLGVSATLSNTNTHVFTVNVPAGATAGTARLRVRAALFDETYTAGDACKTMEYGETEDYSINIVVPTTYTLTVANAGTSGSPVNGSHSYSPSTSVTATAGTNPGFVLSGWTGTGSVPTSGTGNSVTFTISANSTITWNWVSATATNAPVFHDFGGTEQLAFNNSRFNIGERPVFRLSHTLNAATNYEIEINTAPDYSGTAWVHNFTGTFGVGTQANFTIPASVGFVPTSGTTYYVRARTSGDNGTLWSSWTNLRYSFTHDVSETTPNWYQVTQPQLLTAAHQGTQATSAGIMLAASAGGNPIANPTFANTSGWTTWKTFGTEALIDVSSTDCSNCPSGTNRNLKMYLWTASVLGGDMMIVSQQVDLTGIDQITYNASSYYGPNSSNPGGAISNLRFIIGGTSSNEVGTVMHTTSQAYCPTYCTNSVNDPNITVNTSGFTGVHTIKFVVKFSQTHSTAGLLSFYVNNVVASADPVGRAISTEAHLASVKDAAMYESVEWTQNLNGGNLKLKVQQYDGSAWADVVGYDNITSATDGLNRHDISAMFPYGQIRLVADLSSSTSLVMNDWSIKFPVINPLPVSLRNFNGHCVDGLVKLDWITLSEQNNDHFTVQRSADLLTWESLPPMQGSGNSNLPIAYGMVDARPLDGVSYYRLVQFDYDGTSETFSPVAVICGKNGMAIGVSVYPNPATDQFTVSLQTSIEMPIASIKIIDINGRSVVSSQVKLMEGANEIVFDKERLASGTYIIYVQSESHVFPPAKLVVQ